MIASLTELPTTSEHWARLPAEVDVVEVRGDLLGESSPQRLHQVCTDSWASQRDGLKLLFTQRSAAEREAAARCPRRGASNG